MNKIWDCGLRIWDWGFGVRVSGIEQRVSSIEYRASSIQYPASSILIIVLLILFVVSPALALTKMGELSEYYIDYADVKQGATISSPCKANPHAPNLENIITPLRESFFIFADGPDQHEEFTIDLGQERMLGEIIFEMTNATVFDMELKRKPNMVRVEISTQSANGPWTEVYKLDPADVIESFALENVPARWLHFDLGVNTDGIGSRVRKVKIYKRYQLRPGPELMKEFYTQFKRDAPGLEEFWKAVDAGKWEDACDRLIEHFAKWPPEQKGKASPRVAEWMKNEITDGGALYKFGSTDWDWLRQKAECDHGSLGGLPGASSVLQLFKSSYTATGDEVYANQLAALLKDWLQDLPCPGVHRGQDSQIVSGWAGIVASQRCWSFGEMAHAMCKENKYFDRDLKINLIYSFWEHVNYLRAIYSDMGGNWLTNANCCLFAAAVNYPEFTQYKEWLEGSKSYFEVSLLRDFYPSGRASEDSTMYVPIASNQVSGQYSDMTKAGITVSRAARQRMEKLWDCFAAVTYPDLSVPAVGDAVRDTPLIKGYPPVPADYLALFNRPDLVYINTQGKQGRMPKQASRAFSDVGWYVMRSPWDTKPYADARQMFFKASTTQGHGQRDQLEVTMYAYGREILTDPGVSGYGLPIGLKINGTSAHSTICVDDQDQGGCVGTEHLWIAQPGMDFVDAEVAPYRALVQRRQIAFLKSGLGAPDYWLIRDRITGQGEHKYDLNYHFGAGADPKIKDGSVFTTYRKGGNALIRCLDQSVKPEMVDSWVGCLAQSLTPSKTCRYTKQQAVPVEFDTLVIPFEGRRAPKIKAEYLTPDPECAGADAVCVTVATEFGRDFIVISSVPGTALSFGNGRIKTDAAVAVIRTDKKGKVVYAFSNTGSTTYNGKPISTK